MSREPFEGSLPDNLRAVQSELDSALKLLEVLLEFQLPPLTAQNLLPAHRQLIKARASLGMAALAAQQEAQD